MLFIVEFDDQNNITNYNTIDIERFREVFEIYVEDTIDELNKKPSEILNKKCRHFNYFIDDMKDEFLTSTSIRLPTELRKQLWEREVDKNLPDLMARSTHNKCPRTEHNFDKKYREVIKTLEDYCEDRTTKLKDLEATKYLEEDCFNFNTWVNIWDHEIKKKMTKLDIPKIKQYLEKANFKCNINDLDNLQTFFSHVHPKDIKGSEEDPRNSQGEEHRTDEYHDLNSTTEEGDGEVDRKNIPSTEPRQETPVVQEEPLRVTPHGEDHHVRTPPEIVRNGESNNDREHAVSTTDTRSNRSKPNNDRGTHTTKFITPKVNAPVEGKKSKNASGSNEPKHEKGTSLSDITREINAQINKYAHPNQEYTIFQCNGLNCRSLKPKDMKSTYEGYEVIDSTELVHTGEGVYGDDNTYCFGDECTLGDVVEGQVDENRSRGNRKRKKGKGKGKKKDHKPVDKSSRNGEGTHSYMTPGGNREDKESTSYSVTDNVVEEEAVSCPEDDQSCIDPLKEQFIIDGNTVRKIAINNIPEMEIVTKKDSPGDIYKVPSPVDVHNEDTGPLLNFIIEPVKYGSEENNGIVHEVAVIDDPNLLPGQKLITVTGEIYKAVPDSNEIVLDGNPVPDEPFSRSYPLNTTTTLEGTSKKPSAFETLMSLFRNVFDTTKRSSITRRSVKENFEFSETASMTSNTSPLHQITFDIQPPREKMVMAMLGQESNFASLAQTQQEDSTSSSESPSRSTLPLPSRSTLPLPSHSHSHSPLHSPSHSPSVSGSSLVSGSFSVSPLFSPSLSFSPSSSFNLSSQKFSPVLKTQVDGRYVVSEYRTNVPKGIEHYITSVPVALAVFGVFFVFILFNKVNSFGTSSKREKRKVRRRRHDEKILKRDGEKCFENLMEHSNGWIDKGRHDIIPNDLYNVEKKEETVCKFLDVKECAPIDEASNEKDIKKNNKNKIKNGHVQSVLIDNAKKEMEIPNLIELHLDAIEECNHDEWEEYKSEFLEICIEEFFKEKEIDGQGRMMEKKYKCEDNLNNIDILMKKKLMWNKWIERNRYLMNNWKDEEWFHNIKCKWENEIEEYFKLEKYDKNILKICEKNRENNKRFMIEILKMIWKKWIEKNVKYINESVTNEWINQLVIKYKNDYIDLNKDYIMLLKDIYDMSLDNNNNYYYNNNIEYLNNENLIKIMFIQIYILVLEEYKKEQFIQNVRTFLDICLDDIKEKETKSDETNNMLKSISEMKNKYILKKNKEKEIMNQLKNDIFLKNIMCDWKNCEEKFINDHFIENEINIHRMKKDIPIKHWNHVYHKWLHEDNKKEDMILTLKGKEKENEQNVIDESSLVAKKKKWKTIIEIYIEVMNEYKKDEWEEYRGDFLQICLEQFINKDNDKMRNINDELYIEQSDHMEDILMLERQKIIWLQWIKRNKYMLEKWNREEWFRKLKKDWVDEKNRYDQKLFLWKNTETDKYINPMLERQKYIWRKWIAKHLYHIDIWENEEWFKLLMSKYEKDKNNKMDDMERKKLITKLFIEIHMMVIEDFKKEECYRNKQTFVDTYIDELKKEESCEKYGEMLNILNDIKKNIILGYENPKLNEWKQEKWFENLKKEWKEGERKNFLHAENANLDKMQVNRNNTYILEIQKAILKNYWEDMQIKWIDDDNKTDWLKIAIKLNDYDNDEYIKNIKYEQKKNDFKEEIEMIKKINKKVQSRDTEKDIMWKAAIEIHMKIIEEDKKQEWEKNKGDFLEICMQEFLNENQNSHNENSSFVNDYMVQKNYVIKRKNEIWNKCIERNRYVIEKWKKEKWFEKLKNEWKNQQKIYINTREVYLNINDETNIKKVNPLIESEKVLWKKWLRNQKGLLEKYNEQFWFKKVVQDYEKEVENGGGYGDGDGGDGDGDDDNDNDDNDNDYDDNDNDDDDNDNDNDYDDNDYDDNYNDDNDNDYDDNYNDDDDNDYDYDDDANDYDYNYDDDHHISAHQQGKHPEDLIALNKISNQSLSKCKMNKLITTMWIEIHMMILEECKEEEIQLNKELFLDSCIKELIREKDSKGKRKMLEIVSDLKDKHVLINKNLEMNKRKGKNSNNLFENIKTEVKNNENSYIYEMMLKNGMNKSGKMRENDCIYDEMLINNMRKSGKIGEKNDNIIEDNLKSNMNKLGNVIEKCILEMEKNISMRHWENIKKNCINVKEKEKNIEKIENIGNIDLILEQKCERFNVEPYVEKNYEEKSKIFNRSNLQSNKIINQFIDNENGKDEKKSDNKNEEIRYNGLTLEEIYKNSYTRNSIEYIPYIDDEEYSSLDDLDKKNNDFESYDIFYKGLTLEEIYKNAYTRNSIEYIPYIDEEAL